MLSKIKDFFTRLSGSQTPQNTANQPTVLGDARRIQKENDIKTVTNCLEYLDKQSKNLKNLNSIVKRIVKDSNVLIENNITSDNLNFLLHYIPIVTKIIEEHVRYRECSRNNLNLFWNLVKSKNILIRFSQTLYDRSKSIETHKVEDFSAELSALDSILKINGY